MITNYHIAQAYSRGELVREVQRLIDMGWQPQGGVNIHVDSIQHTDIYSQALVATKGAK